MKNESYLYNIFQNESYFWWKINVIFLRLNTMLNKKNGCSESHDLSIKHNNKTNRRIKIKEVMRHTYCDEFDNTVNDDIQWDVVAAVVVKTTTNTCSAFQTNISYWLNLHKFE